MRVADPKRLIPAALALALACAGGHAAAQPRAAVLFEEGKRLYDAGRLDEACATLAESQRLDPRVGTLGLLASCHEKQGRLATAWREYVETATRARASGDDREGYARAQAAALEPRLPSLLVRAPHGSTVKRDGAPVADAEIGVDVFVDPGRHVVDAKLPSGREVHEEIAAVEGRHVVVDVAPTEAQTAEAPPAGPRRPGPSQRKLVGYAVGATGAVALAAGVGFGIAALAQKSRSDHYCDADGGCSTVGGSLRDDARGSATLATIGLVVGAAGLGTGAYLVLTDASPREAAPAPRTSARKTARVEVAPGFGSVTVRGSF